MNYFTFGTNDMEKSVGFYDQLFQDTGMNRINSKGRMTLWTNEEFMFGIAEQFDGEQASNGNGTMLGIDVGSPEEVDHLLCGFAA